MVLEVALRRAEKSSRHKIEQTHVDKGYQDRNMKQKKVWISTQKRRQAIEPHIGYMKNDGKLGKNHLKGCLGSLHNAILCEIGHNLISYESTTLSPLGA